MMSFLQSFAKGLKHTDNNKYLVIPLGFFSYIVKKLQGVFLLRDYIEQRAVHIANYILESNATVRQTAKAFGVSKSTVHKDVSERLLMINPSLARSVRKILDVNKAQRHIRGGMATKEKYAHRI